MSILRVSWSEPSAGQKAAEQPSLATASARATPPQLSTPPHCRFPRAPAGLSGSGPESSCCTRSCTVAEARTPACGRTLPAAFVLGGPKAKSCQYVRGRVSGQEGGAQSEESGGNGLRLEKEAGPGAQRSERGS